MKWHTVVFDLDNTLIRTERIKQHFFAQLQDAGLDDATIAKAYTEAMQNEHGENTFSRERFSEVTGVPLLLEGLQENQLQVRGASDALQACINRGIPTYIVTLGTEDWQREKIAISGLAHYLENGVTLITTTDTHIGKSSALKNVCVNENSNKGPVLLINDKPDETAELLGKHRNVYAYIRREINDKRYSPSIFAKLIQHPRILGLQNDLENFSECLAVEYTNYPDIPMHVSCGAIVKDTYGKILVLGRSSTSTYHLPKGTIDNNDSPKATVEREVLEESGYVVLAQELIATRLSSYKRNKKNILKKTIYFDAAVMQCDRTIPDDEHDSCEFLSVTDAKNRLATQGAHISLGFEREDTLLS